MVFSRWPETQFQIDDDIGSDFRIKRSVSQILNVNMLPAQVANGYHMLKNEL